MKLKNLRCTKSLYFRGNHRGIWLFPQKLCLRVVNRLTTWRDFIVKQNIEIFVRACDHLQSFTITPLRQGVWYKFIIPWQSAGKDKNVGVPHFIQSIYWVPTKLQNTFIDFQHFHFQQNWNHPTSNVWENKVYLIFVQLNQKGKGRTIKLVHNI